MSRVLTLVTQRYQCFKVPTAQKKFYDNMVWELQGSKSAGEYYVHLAKFNTNYPDVKVNVWFIVPRVLHIIVH
jgi:hypothetical protein